jgi:hypothetical protein
VLVTSYNTEIAAFMQLLGDNGDIEPISQAITSPYPNAWLLKKITEDLTHEGRHELIMIREILHAFYINKFYLN